MDTERTPATISESRRKNLLQAYYKEYDYLKNEQLQSIGMRFTLVYVLLFLYTAVFSYAVSSPSHHYAFLLLPWI